MKKATLFLTALAAVALVVAAPGLAQKVPEQKAMHQEMTGCAQLNLTPEQQGKIQKLCLDFQKELIGLRAGVETKALELRKLILEKAETSAINAAIDGLAKARAEIQKKSFAHRQQVRSLLTDEQKKTFDQMGCGMGMEGKGCGKGRMHHGGGKGCGHGRAMKGCGKGCGR